MPRKYLTEKQKAVCEEIAKGKEPLVAVKKFYNVGGKNPDVSARVIWYKLNHTELFNTELTHQKDLVKEIIYSEGRKLVDILQEIFPNVERAKILVEIARSDDIKSKLEAIKEMNRLAGEYPKPEPESKTEIGEFHITMIKTGDIKGKEPQEAMEGEIIEPKQLFGGLEKKKE